MCVVSMVTDHYRTWPNDRWTQISWDEYHTLKRKAAEYDRMTNQPHCEKPDLEIWEKAIEEYLKKKGIIK